VPMRLATKRCSSGCTVRSFLATMYSWASTSRLYLGQVSRETLDASGAEPYALVCDLDVIENVRNGKLLLLALRCLVGDRGKCSDVD
jgi:hypothetical protein